MQKPVIAVFDKKIALFDTTFTVRHPGEAIREWDLVRKDSNTKYGKNPEDYDLYQIANFNEETGEYTMLTPHLHLAAGV